MKFSEATLEIMFQTLIPVGDMVAGGKISGGIDEIGDRSEAARIVCEESAEFFAAVRDAARRGVPTGSISEIVSEAKDVMTAKALLADPSLVVELDGELVTADDDTAEESG